jgi:acyl dehydratase
MSLYFEDLVVGTSTDLGQHTFTREEIVAFAAQFDPQPFHLSEEAAAGMLFGALCASGWHTGSVWLRLMVDNRQREAAELTRRGDMPARYGPSPGFEKIRWIKPVFVGDTIRYRTQIHEKRDLKSKPGVGLLLSLNEGHNQNGDLAFAVISKMFVERRGPLAG